MVCGGRRIVFGCCCMVLGVVAWFVVVVARLVEVVAWFVVVVARFFVGVACFLEVVA